MLRRPAVAGQFYPADAAGLSSQIALFADEGFQKVEAKGVVAPHAGIIYSGGVAGAVYSMIEMPETFVILGPNHTGRGKSAAIMTRGSWRMPSGAVPIDDNLARMMIEYSDCLADDESSHEYEHSIEMQVIFIQHFKTDIRIVPVCLKSAAFEVCRDVGRAAARAVEQTGERALFVASTDMSHYVRRETAQAKDRLAIDRILALDARGLYDVVLGENISMCGFMPTVAAVIACKELGAERAELVKYSTSGDISGDYDHVVGYAGLIII